MVKEAYIQRIPLRTQILRSIISLIPATLRVLFYRLWINVHRRLHGAELYCSVYRLSFGLVLKPLNRNGTSVEADALRVVNSLQGVHAPHLVDSVMAGTTNYMLSTWIEGQSVGEIWDDLSPTDKDLLVSQLRVQFAALRSQAMSTTHPICNASGGPIIDPRIPWFQDHDPRILTRSKDFAAEVWCGLDGPRNSVTLKPLIQPIIEQQDVPIVFSHGDLLPRNLVIPGSLKAWREGGLPVHLIDWEYAGWMPTYWDPLKATWLECDPTDTEWVDMVRQIFPENGRELDIDWEWRSHSRVLIL